MNYSEMSDFEINKAVAEAYLGYYEPGFRFVNTGIDSSNHYGEEHPVRRITANRKYWKAFEPCGNPSDAWPIILENNISLLSNTDHFLDPFMESPSMWFASAGSCENQDSESWSNGSDNPLRAAMIVFLMMQEQSDEN